MSASVLFTRTRCDAMRNNGANSKQTASFLYVFGTRGVRIVSIFTQCGSTAANEMNKHTHAHTLSHTHSFTRCVTRVRARRVNMCVVVEVVAVDLAQLNNIDRMCDGRCAHEL